MSKILLLVIVGSAVTLAFQTPCSKNATTYKVNRDVWYEPEVEDYVEKGWEKLVATNMTRNATGSHGSYIHTVREESVGDNDKRYTILVLYQTTGIGNYLYCYIFVQAMIDDSFFIDCYEGYLNSLANPKDIGQFNMFNYLYNALLNKCYE